MSRKTVHTNPVRDDQRRPYYVAFNDGSDRAETTVYAYRNIARRHVLSALGPFPLRRLSPVRIQTCLYDKMDGGLSSTTVLKRHILLTTALRKVERMEPLSVNPMKRVSPLKEEAAKYKNLYSQAPNAGQAGLFPPCFVNFP